MLIQNGADVNAVSMNEMTALHWAANSKNARVIKVLLQNGADVNAVDEYEHTALFITARGKSARCTLTLLCVWC